MKLSKIIYALVFVVLYSSSSIVFALGITAFSTGGLRVNTSTNTNLPGIATGDEN